MYDKLWKCGGRPPPRSWLAGRINQLMNKNYRLDGYFTFMMSFNNPCALGGAIGYVVESGDYNGRWVSFHLFEVR